MCFKHFNKFLSNFLYSKRISISTAQTHKLWCIPNLANWCGALLNIPIPLLWNKCIYPAEHFGVMYFIDYYHLPERQQQKETEKESLGPIGTGIAFKYRNINGFCYSLLSGWMWSAMQVTGSTVQNCTEFTFDQNLCIFYI